MCVCERERVLCGLSLRFVYKLYQFVIPVPLLQTSRAIFERTMNVAWSQTTRQRPDSTSTNEASSQVVPAPPRRRMTCLWTSLSCFPRNWPTRCQRRTSKQLLFYGTKNPELSAQFSTVIDFLQLWSFVLYMSSYC